MRRLLVGSYLVVSYGWRVLGEHIRRERKARKQTQSDFAAEIGISVTLLRQLENGRRDNYDPGTRSIIEAALGWAAGSIELVVGGAQPRRAEDLNLREIRSLWGALTPESRSAIATIVRAIARHGA